MLEQSNLNETIIKKIVQENYGLEIEKVKHINRGSANIYNLDNKYILKEFPSDRKIEQITKEYNVIKYLTEKNFRVPTYEETKDNNYYIEYKNRIINIHPSLIPSFCGDKMYGMHVHNAVKKSGVRYTGCTVHFVNEEVDGGAIILQETVPVYFEDTAEDIQKRVLVQEHKLLPKAIELIGDKKIQIIDGIVKIDK